MTIGIAIPTYDKHFYHLKNLLSIISQSSVIPNQVSVSISSYDGETVFDEYPFELIVTTTKEIKNPSENRNIAASLLTTDIISFIDGDDIPHVKRNEFLLESFNMGAQAVVHNYYQDFNNESEWFKTNLEPINYLHEYVDTIEEDCPFAKNSTHHQDYHCAHISIKKGIFNRIKYDESPEIVYSEDSVYTKQLVSNGVKISYLSNKLSHYVK